MRRRELQQSATKLRNVWTHHRWDPSDSALPAQASAVAASGAAESSRHSASFLVDAIRCAAARNE